MFDTIIPNAHYVLGGTIIGVGTFFSPQSLPAGICGCIGGFIAQGLALGFYGLCRSLFFPDIKPLKEETEKIDPIILTIVLPVVEELVARGLFRWLLVTKLNLTRLRGALISNLIWTMAHTPGNDMPKLAYFPAIFSTGLMLAGIREKYGLQASITAHILCNSIIAYIHSIKYVATVTRDEDGIPKLSNGY